MTPKDKRDENTCWHCGDPLPSSRVAVFDEEKKFVGRVCGHHPIAQIILDRGDGQHRFSVKVTLVEDPWGIGVGHAEEARRGDEPGAVAGDAGSGAEGHVAEANE